MNDISTTAEDPTHFPEKPNMSPVFLDQNGRPHFPALDVALTPLVDTTAPPRLPGWGTSAGNMPHLDSDQGLL